MSRLSTMVIALTSALALTSGAAVTASAAPTTPAAAATAGSTVPATADARVEPVQWTPCNPDPSKPDPKIYDCAVYPVPLDYAKPYGETIGIAMLRRRAGDPAKRIGSLFMNPGGPGGSGYLWATTARFQPKVTERFDMIGFDPRGVARSKPLRCFTTNEEATSVFQRMIMVPVTRTEVNGTLAATRDFTASCTRNAGDLIRHMSTMNVVRDLDRMRRAVGDKKLTFAGFSYGTLIGATYANMYPDKVRAVIIDGNVDPNLRLHDGLEYDRQRATGGFEPALAEYLKRCKAVGVPRCAFAEGDTRAKFDAIRDHLRTTPVTLPDGQEVNLSTFTNNVANALYSQTRLAPLAVSLQAVHQVISRQQGLATGGRIDTEAAARLAQTYPGGLREAPADTPYTSDDSYFGVNCQDKPYPSNPRVFAHLARAWERNAPTFGRYQAFDSPTCATWPAPARSSERYAGPWNRRTANKIMVIGNTFDPATQYRFSQRMQRQLGNAVLVTVDVIEHCAIGRSKALDAQVTSYLVDGTPPKPGQVLKPDLDPFPMLTG
ncbi:alpha/beta hydrolase [Streptomyces bambusae]|uniref:alpha/beta hydrolase n=1 Tax=Streptomyces bambusae TaxID=1550616 RepID=UPI001CFCE848|nr:alpha/beta hydrolase [Streptomyces bambusae]MCB5163971.1 alpha/beta hydrolase [Streptomyces bambusae]